MTQPAAYRTGKPVGARQDSLPCAETAGSDHSELADHEKWLYNNPEALAAVQRGLADSAAGRGVKMSFVEFADVDIDD